MSTDCHFTAACDTADSSTHLPISADWHLSLLALWVVTGAQTVGRDTPSGTQQKAETHKTDVRSANFLDVTPCSQVQITYVVERAWVFPVACFAYTSSLNWGGFCSSVPSVNFYWTIQCHHENLKSNKLDINLKRFFQLKLCHTILKNVHELCTERRGNVNRSFSAEENRWIFTSTSSIRSSITLLTEGQLSV